jgi:aminopeptidase N
MALFTPEGKEIPLASPLLELKQAEQTFVFENLKEKPLVSLLREFSAPILLVQDQTDAELLALLRFEKDSYAKWNAAQILLKTTMLSFYQKGSQEVGEALIEAYSGLLSAEHPSLCAELLTLPDWQELLVSVQEADVIALLDAKEALARQLGSALYEKAEQKYQALWQEEKGLLTPAAFANRKLRNRCLWWMMKGNPASALLICQEQFVQAKTMTDSIASFTLLNQVQDPLVREQAIRHFYQRWQNNELVLDKWFSIQASCEEGNALERVQALLQHPAFSMQNPNKVRAVLGSFCQNNPRHFHAIDGSGYTFLQNKILALDAINPQIAARLAMPFTRYKAYDKKRQALLQEVLLAMQKTLLSKELSEVVSKSLGA